MKIQRAVGEVLKDERKDDKISFKKALPFVVLSITIVTTFVITILSGLHVVEWDDWEKPMFFMVVTFVASLGPYIFSEWMKKE